MDTEASVRTNTCILIGRLGPSLGYNTKRKVLVPAFSRALKDPFVHARVAGLMAFMATIECFEISELASKVIPNMAFTLVDQEKSVVPLENCTDNHIMTIMTMFQTSPRSSIQSLGAIREQIGRTCIIDGLFRFSLF
jgi:hypothetical protein